jgi:uncharacterized phage protein (TIGR01671 family)
MREIKFRAWNKKLKRFAPEDCNIQIQGDDAHVSFDTFDGNFDTEVWDLKDIELLQFTGLVDFDGTDIYEGDIVAMPYVDPMGGIHYVNDFLSDVIFERGCFQVWGNELKPERINIENWIERTEGEYKSNYGNVYKWGGCVLTVIGNIYENPELLK